MLDELQITNKLAYNHWRLDFSVEFIFFWKYAIWNKNDESLWYKQISKILILNLNFLLHFIQQMDFYTYMQLIFYVYFIEKHGKWYLFRNFTRIICHQFKTTSKSICICNCIRQKKYKSNSCISNLQALLFMIAMLNS